MCVLIGYMLTYDVCDICVREGVCGEAFVGVFAVSPVHAEMAKQRIDQTLLVMFCW